MSHRPFKQRLYREFARIGQSLGSEIRLELLDLLAQAPRHVDALASELEMPKANISQHLQVLLRARLVDMEREGTKTFYRLADDRVLRLWLALRDVAERQLPEIEHLTREFGVDGASNEELRREEILQLVEQGRALLIDVRPLIEFEHGHLPGAISLPVDELSGRLGDLPTNRRIVAYCRGAYCLFADEAVTLLRQHGFDAVRLEGGWPEWLDEGRPVVRQSS